jgi:hypothetical protein
MWGSLSSDINCGVLGGDMVCAHNMLMIINVNFCSVRRQWYLEIIPKARSPNMKHLRLQIMQFFLSEDFQIFKTIQAHPSSVAAQRLHHASIALTRVKIRDAQSYSLSTDIDEALNKPLIPDLSIVSLSPKANFKLGSGRQLNRLLYWWLAYQ